MNLHEWLKYNNLDLKDIVKVEQAFYYNKSHLLDERLKLILYEWLTDPERLFDAGGSF